MAALTRIDREAQFHDHRFADDSERAATGKFYRAAPDGQLAYKARVEELGRGRVLEYGCGTGSEAFELAQRGAVVTAIDISSTAISMAAARADQLGLDIELREMNAEQLDFAPDSFDLVCGSGILHHLDTEVAAQQIKQVVAPGGRAVFLEPMGYNPAINWYRDRTPGMRTPDEHPLRRTDLVAYASVCRSMDVRYYGLLALGAAPVLNRSGGAPLAASLRALDRAVLRLPGVRLLAWMAVLDLQF